MHFGVLNPKCIEIILKINFNINVNRITLDFTDIFYSCVHTLEKTTIVSYTFHIYI